jgi:GTPase SAR1 family protein
LEEAIAQKIYDDKQLQQQQEEEGKGEELKESQEPVPSFEAAAEVPSATLLSSITTSPTPHSSAPTPIPCDETYVKELASKIELLGNSKLTVALLDFGGQSVFDVFRHLFMRKDTIYLIVFDMQDLLSGAVHREATIKELQSSANSVMIHTFDKEDKRTAVTVFVGTHADLVKEEADRREINSVLTGLFASTHLCRLEYEQEQLFYFPINNTIGRGDVHLIQLMTALEEQLMLQNSSVLKQVPFSWLKVLDAFNESPQADLEYT